MAKTLEQYAAGLEERDLIWPVPPKEIPVQAEPFLAPMKGIRAVTWSVYGTLLRITDGKLLHIPPQPLRLQVALEKTIEEFNMWNSMSRKSGAPWEYLAAKYERQIDQMRMAGTQRIGDAPAVDSVEIWRKLVHRLQQKDYDFDKSVYGDLDQFCEKVAYFFHRCLQGCEAAPGALATILTISSSQIRQGLLADSQAFTMVQLSQALRKQGASPPMSDVFLAGNALSHEVGVIKPSRTLYQTCLERLAAMKIEPDRVLHVGSRLREDLAVAKSFGMRTALYAREKVGLEATAAELKDPAMKPDRLLTDLNQIREILEIG